jgi:hypothetical protein
MAFFSMLDEKVATYQPMVDQLSTISENNRVALDTLERIIRTADEDKNPEHHVSALLDKLLVITERSERIVAVLEMLIGPNAKSGDLTTLDEYLIAHERRIFGYGAALLVLLAALVIAVRFFWLRIGENQK